MLPLAEIKSRLFGHSLVLAAVLRVRRPGRRRRGRRAPRSIDAARDLAADARRRHLESAQPRRRGDADWPRKDLYVTFRKEIAPDAEANLNAIPRKQRAMVRKGIKHGLRERDRRDVDALLRRSTPTTCTATARRCSRNATSRLLQEVFGDDCEVLTITDATASRSRRAVFYFRDEVLPYYGGGMRRQRATSPATTSSTGS